MFGYDRPGIVEARIASAFAIAHPFQPETKDLASETLAYFPWPLLEMPDHIMFMLARVPENRDSIAIFILCGAQLSHARAAGGIPNATGRLVLQTFDHLSVIDVLPLGSDLRALSICVKTIQSGRRNR